MRTGESGADAVEADEQAARVEGGGICDVGGLGAEERSFGHRPPPPPRRPPSPGEATKVSVSPMANGTAFVLRWHPADLVLPLATAGSTVRAVRAADLRSSLDLSRAAVWCLLLGFLLHCSCSGPLEPFRIRGG